MGMLSTPVPVGVLTAALCGLVCTVCVSALARLSLRHAVLWSPVTAVFTIAAGTSAGTHYMVPGGHTSILSVIMATAPIAVLTGFVVSRRVYAALAEQAKQVDEAREHQRIDAARLELVTWMSHDLRSPLAGIRAMGEAIDDGIAADTARYGRRIANEAERMNGMLTDLLELARMNTVGLALHRERISVSDIVSDCIAHQEPTARARGVSIRGSVEGRTVLSADARLLTRAIDNVLSNAVFYTQADTAVDISVRGDTDGVHILLSDACACMSAEDARSAFNVGWRKDQARTPGGGSGLGLPIARAIVEAHGGDITLAPTEQGCQVRIFLPNHGD